MKNIIGFIGYYLLTFTGITWIGNKILDALDSKVKDNPETEHYPIKHIKKSTVYPDGIYPDRSTKDFNNWTKYVCDQSFNNYRN